jgi:hypothetical protein
VNLFFQLGVVGSQFFDDPVTGDVTRRGDPLTFRFLFAYHDLGFPGPMVGQYEFTPRSKQ